MPSPLGKGCRGSQQADAAGEGIRYAFPLFPLFPLPLLVSLSLVFNPSGFVRAVNNAALLVPHILTVNLHGRARSESRRSARGIDTVDNKDGHSRAQPQDEALLLFADGVVRRRAFHSTFRSDHAHTVVGPVRFIHFFSE